MRQVERRGSVQARGVVRRQLLLDAARDLLESKDVDQINLADVAARADIPKSSAYHFYPDVSALYGELAFQLADELRAAINRPVPKQPAWKDIFAILLDRGIDFLLGDRAAMRLLLGPKTSFEIKRSDRLNDKELAQAIIDHIQQQFRLPELAKRDVLFFRAVEILDLFLSLSVQEEGVITMQMRNEAHRAAHAYLAIYIPQILPPAGSVVMPAEDADPAR